MVPNYGTAAKFDVQLCANNRMLWLRTKEGRAEVKGNKRKQKLHAVHGDSVGSGYYGNILCTQ